MLPLRQRTALLPASLALLLAAPACAQNITCTASMSALAFGTVNPLASQTDATATLTYSCTNGSNQTRSARVCFSIGEPGGGATNPRLMSSGANKLQFQMYQDAARSLVWGSSFFGAFATPFVTTFTLAKNTSTGSQTATLYGRVLANQATVVPGAYTNPYLNADTAITINEANGTTPPSACSMTQTGQYFPFTVSATVDKRCNVSASALDFGTTGLLTAATPGTSTIGVQCSAGAAYTVGLDAGLNGGGNINARRMVLGTGAVGYQLYSNATRTTVWGNTTGSNTVAGSGTGATQNYTVYGLVPAQTTPAAGTYQDTITVTVTY